MLNNYYRNRVYVHIDRAMKITKTISDYSAKYQLLLLYYEQVRYILYIVSQKYHLCENQYAV